MSQPPILVGDARLERIDLGEASMPDGWIHRKILPDCILVEPLAGTYTVQGSGAPVRIGVGELCLVGPAVPVTFHHHADGRGRMRARWAHIQASWPAVLLATLGRQTPCRIVGSAAARGRRLLAQLHRAADTGDGMAHRWSQAGVALQLLAGALTQVPYGAAPKNPAAAPAIVALLSWMEAHLAESISIARLCRVAGMSRSRLHDHVRRFAGTSPRAWLQELRLRAVARLLLEAPQPLAAIATTTGFANPFHLSRAFARRYGVPPATYRQQQRWHPGSGAEARSLRSP